jgi:L-serine kinase (ATP) / ParB family transcriptional regulator, heme-responsive regulator
METAEVVVDPRRLIQHERVQQERLRRVAAEVARDGIRIPIAVAPVGDDRYFVLDGAHRSTAAAQLGLPDVPCTVVELGDAPQIEGWTHRISGLRLPTADGALLTGRGNGPVVATVRAFGRRWQVRAADDTTVAVHRAFHQVGALYRHLPYERARKPVPGAWCQVTWRIPQWDDLVELVSGFGPLPAGVTRFEIERRVGELPLAA